MSEKLVVRFSSFFGGISVCFCLSFLIFIFRWKSEREGEGGRGP